MTALDAGVTDADGERSRVLAEAIDAARGIFKAEIDAGRGGRAALAYFSDCLDDLVRGLVRDAADSGGRKFLVCALGGYGRRQLCLHSDLDLLVVFDGSIRAREERFLKALLHPLWDLKLTVGHHVRELSELARFDEDNPEFLLALIDVRFLAGDRGVFERFQISSRDASPEIHPRIVDELLRLTELRHAQFGETHFQVEPDVKNAPGGLRDIWAARTIARLSEPAAARLGPSAADRLDAAEEFLARVRSFLHLKAGKNLNVLTQALQEQVADRLGYPGEQAQPRVEALMSEYSRHARVVTSTLARVRRAVRPPKGDAPRPAGPNLMRTAAGIAFEDNMKAAAEPVSWLGAFAAAVEGGVPVSDEALSLIEREQGVHRYPAERLLPTGADRERLLAFLRPRLGLAARLSEMHDCGLLEALFPEFRAISSRAIRDFYHKYTVDEHTLVAIGNLERLLDEATPEGRERFGPILRELRSPELLVLALLYHDVGKWLNDEDHSEEGARMARAMAERLDLPEESRDLIDFLIRKHLRMSRVAFRRDTEDPDVVRTFAALFESEERLKMLCLLTLADVGAVSPDTLTPWKEELLWRLYVDAYNQLTLGYGDEVIDRNQAVLSALEASRPEDISEAEMARFLEGLPRRYLLLFSPESVYRHVRLSRDMRPDDAHFLLERKSDSWALTVVTLDKPYLFSNICGVLSYFGMDILRGHALTSLAGLVVDDFQFTDRERFLELNAEGGRQLVQVLSDVVAGRADVTSLLGRKERSVLYRRGPRRVAPVVHFDNKYSRRYTVLEIVADDVLGLLYRISRVVSDHGCDVDLVLISTEGQTAIDVFHIRRGAAKLSEGDQLALRSALLHVLEEDA
jgi:[protein-PII] uridylyltransferase